MIPLGLHETASAKWVGRWVGQVRENCVSLGDPRIKVSKLKVNKPSGFSTN